MSIEGGNSKLKEVPRTVVPIHAGDDQEGQCSPSVAEYMHPQYSYEEQEQECEHDDVSVLTNASWHLSEICEVGANGTYWDF